MEAIKDNAINLLLSSINTLQSCNYNKSSLAASCINMTEKINFTRHSRHLTNGSISIIADMTTLLGLLSRNSMKAMTTNLLLN